MPTLSVDFGTSLTEEHVIQFLFLAVSTPDSHRCLFTSLRKYSPEEQWGEGRDVSWVRSLPGLGIPNFSDPRNPKIPPRKGHEIKWVLHTQLKLLSNIPQTDNRKGTDTKKCTIPMDFFPLHPTMNLTCGVLASDLSDGEG